MVAREAGRHAALPAREPRDYGVMTVQSTERDGRAVDSRSVIDQDQASGDLRGHAAPRRALDLREREVGFGLVLERVNQPNERGRPGVGVVGHATRRMTPTSSTTCNTAPPTQSSLASNRWWGWIQTPSTQFSSIKKSPNSHGFVSPRHLEETWRDQFDWVYREQDYAVFPITIHPDVSGRPQVLLMLERLYRHIASHPGVKFVTMDEMADDFVRRFPRKN